MWPWLSECEKSRLSAKTLYRVFVLSIAGIPRLGTNSIGLLSFLWLKAKDSWTSASSSWRRLVGLMGLFWTALPRAFHTCSVGFKIQWKCWPGQLVNFLLFQVWLGSPSTMGRCVVMLVKKVSAEVSSCIWSHYSSLEGVCTWGSALTFGAG